jgi:D-alanyl-D-alanine carboxypeptidase
MRELALIVLLLLPNWGIFNSARINLNSYLKPIVTKHVETDLVPDIVTGPIKKDTATYSASAKAVYSIDLATDNELVSKNIDQKLQTASLTKLMTAYTILKDQTDFEKEFTVPSLNISTSDSIMGLNPGERMKVGGLLAGLLIPSGADAAITLAVGDAGSVQSFVKKMNDNADTLGLTNSHFSNPIGDDDSNNYSSAQDLSNLTRVLLGNEHFADLVSQKTSYVYTSKGRQIILQSTNELLDTNGYIGVKTGYTLGAGQCLVSLQKVSGHEILTTILGSSDRFGETIATNVWTNTHFLW